MTSPAVALVGRRRQLGLLGTVVAGVLTAAACGADPAEGADALSVDITTPSSGAQVGTPFDLEFDASGELGEPDTGRHHLHIYFDGNTAEGEYKIVYDDSPLTITELGPGEHTIEARVANADHSLTDARDEIAVTVGADAGEPDQQPPPRDNDSDPDY